MAILQSDGVDHTSDLILRRNGTEGLRLTSNNSTAYFNNGVGISTGSFSVANLVKTQYAPLVVGANTGTVHTSGWISLLHEGSSTGALESWSGNLYIRSESGTGTGGIIFQTGSGTFNSRPSLSGTESMAIEGNGTIRFHNGTGRSAMFFPSGFGDIVHFYQNRNGSTPYWFFNTDGNFGVFSDMRLKENITEVDNKNCFDFINSLNPIEFNWKEGYGNTETKLIGFSAQNILQSSITEGQKNAITNWECYDENNIDCPFLGLADHRLIPSLVGAIKELISKIETLEIKVEQLEAI
jgi:hypothetical protein